MYDVIQLKKTSFREFPGNFPVCDSFVHMYASRTHVLILKMKSWFRDTLSNLYNAARAPVAATRNVLAERLQSVRDTVTLLYNRTKEKLGYGGETLKDIVEDEAQKEHQEKANQEEKQ